ncbi:MAG: 6-pyruvoyl-tetrahydropterin synthase-related protein, partial [Pyrinomonadaceae bacterium]
MQLSPNKLRYLAPALVLACGVAIIVPALLRGLPVGADFNNHYRHALPLYDSLRAGHFDPGWLAESNDGYGDARFRFYPPATYYLLSATRFVAGDWYAGSLITFALLSSVGALGVFAWGRRLGASRWIAALAGALYAIAPYHLNELYQASFLAEYAACAVLPWCFAFTQGVFDSRRSVSRARDVAGLGLSYAALVLSHLPLTVIGSLSLGVYALLLARRARSIKPLAIFAAGVVLGLVASAFYWVG